MQSIHNTKNSTNFVDVQVSKNMGAVQSKHSVHSQSNQACPENCDQNNLTKASIHTTHGQVASDIATKHISSQHPSKSLFNDTVVHGQGSKMSVQTMNQIPSMSKTSNAITADQVMLQNGNQTTIENLMSKQIGSKQSVSMQQPAF